MFTLGIDTSNYATSLAVFDTDAEEVVCACKRFLPVKEGQLGLRQSDTVFHHTQALAPMLEELNAQFPVRRAQAIGVSVKPRPVEGSYMPCFTVGTGTARALALALGVPLCETTHQQGHIAAALFAAGDSSLFARETLVFHISGGTTELLRCRDGQVLEKMGESTDLYAGQAVDRIGVRLGFAFPAGAQLSQLAAEWPEPVRAKVSLQGANCSFSGLENQCGALLDAGKPPAFVAKYCLCAVGRTVLGMIRAARLRCPDAPVVCAGGVMSSDIIRTQVQQAMPDVHFVPAQYASDNAIGVAILAAKEAGAWPM